MPTNDPVSAELNDTIDRLIADWPAEVRKADPGRSDALARHQWMKQMEPIAQRIAAEDRKAASNTPRHMISVPPDSVKW